MYAGTDAASDEQRTGTLKGIVVNEVTREPLVTANVRIVGTQTGTSTGADGRFVIPNLPPGVYAVEVSMLGFGTVVRSDVVVMPAKPADLSIPLHESPVELGGVNVSADYFRNSPDAPVSTQVQTNEEIRRLPGGFEDVVRAVSILPGVAQVQAGRNDLIVRGGAPSENLYVVDNIEVPNINHFGTQGASGGPLSYINLDFVNSTSFSSGGFGVRYGDRLSSVLNIDLRDGRNDRLGGKATISATQFGLNLEGPLNQSGSFLFSARRSYLDFIFKSAGFGFVPEYWDFMGKGVMKLGDRDQVSLLGIAAIDNVRLFNDTEEKRYDNARILYSDQTQFTGGATWRHLFSSGFTTVTFGQIYTGYRFRQQDTLLRPFFINNSIDYQSSLRVDLLWQPGPAVEISGGVQGSATQFRSDLLLPPFQSSYGEALSINTRTDTAGYKGAGYLQISGTLSALTLTAGLRADYFNMISTILVVAPRVSASLRLSPATTLSASAGLYEQAPPYIWLAANPANRRLDPSRVVQTVIGVDHAVREDTRIRLEVYRKRYGSYPASSGRPYLIMVNTGAGYGGSEEGFASFGLDPLVSGGAGTSWGAEFSTQKKFSQVPCYGLISISYNHADFTALDGVSRPGSFDQRWIINVGGGYLMDERWEFSTKFRLATGRPYTPMNTDGTQSPALFNSGRLPANHALDIRVDRKWIFEEWSLVTYIDVQNVYNHRETGVPRYNYLTHRVEQDSSIGILPSIGVSAEF